MFKIRMLAAAMAGLIAIGAAPAPAQAEGTIWDPCGTGNVCLYDRINGGGKFWEQHGSVVCGFLINLGNQGLNDRASSVWNRGTKYVHLYTWDGVSKWVWLPPALTQGQHNLWNERNNTVDAIWIEC